MTERYNSIDYFFPFHYSFLVELFSWMSTMWWAIQYWRVPSAVFVLISQSWGPANFWRPDPWACVGRVSQSLIWQQFPSTNLLITVFIVVFFKYTCTLTESKPWLLKLWIKNCPSDHRNQCSPFSEPFTSFSGCSDREVNLYYWW